MPWSEPPQLSPTPRATANARVLRRSLTESERRLWWYLRQRLPIASSHFRRQVALGPYVVDFCCLAAKLVIEVDGGQHGRDADIAYDVKRTAALEAQGYRVLRVTNAAVMREIGSVLDTIFAALSEAKPPAAPPPPPTPSPQGGGECAET
jgi:very-short-patch-repair endonuclease